MTETPISTRPLNSNEELVQQKFYESVTAQGDVLDKLGAQLLTLELAIPGVYATLAQLIGGDQARVKINTAFYITFVCWFVALILTFVAITPKKWEVKANVYKQDPKKFDEGLGIADFFEQSASYKRRWIIASSTFFFIGIFCAAFTIG